MTNGASTTYTIRVIPSSYIYTGDQFQIEFPKELRLNPNIVCDVGAASRAYMRKISCLRVGTRGVHFLILDMSTDFKPGIVLEFTVSLVINAISLRPTSSFKNILFFDYSINKKISEYTNTLIVANKNIG